MVGTGVTFNVVPIAESQGLTDQAAALLLTAFAVAMAVTHLVGGVLADRVALHRLLAASAVCMAGSAWLMRELALPGAVVGCGVLMGVAQGLSSGITSVVCVRYWGRLHLGRIRERVLDGGRSRHRAPGRS
jgi:sugar phosphate permease